jgi:signal transduction histidine kinase
VEHVVEAHRTFEGDRDRVLQVLLNLLSNAVKFSPAGSVITISALPITDAEAAGELGGPVTGRAPVRFVVENPGPGIAPRDLDRLFTRFQQLDGSDGRRRGGTGLGLAISKAIVEQHGGRIGVESDPGRTTRFWFELPAVSPGGGSRPD